MKPTQARISVKPDKPLTETEAGLILANPNKPQTGVIVAVGPKVEVAKPGDRVVYHPYAGTEINNLLFMQEKEIIALDGTANN